jgi:RNA polymerase sigma-70 factor (ECF subfamily)
MTASQSPQPEELLEKLLDRAVQGDQRAVGQLLTQFRGRLRKMVMVRMDPRLKSRIDPSDVVQDVLMDASRLLPDYLRDRPLPYYPWLRQLAWQRLYDLHVRHVQAQKRSVAREGGEAMMLSDASIVQLAERVVATGSSPSVSLLRKELRRRVRDALTQMKAEDREVLVLRYLEQLDAKEIAAVVGISQDAVNMRHLRALGRLRRLLGEALGDT